MSYVGETFLLISSSVRKQLLCFVHSQALKKEQKHTTKNFDEFRNHSPLISVGRGKATTETSHFNLLVIAESPLLQKHANYFNLLN